MPQIVFATNNQHKLDEIRQILGDEYDVLSLSDIGFEGDIPETGTSFMENAAQKAQYIYDRYHMDVIADDSGLQVDALGGAPGVYSARYAGEAHDSEANMQKLLAELADSDNRHARFATVIAYIRKLHGLDCVWSLQFFAGTVEGEITRERRGNGGFGYDPIFQPEGYDKTFAELGAEVKNTISHRARAVAKLCQHLSTTYKTVKE